MESTTTKVTLEFQALSWLRFEKHCPVALFERTPRPRAGQPDVLGVTQAGYLLEIEIKRSLADFRHNAKKPHIHFRHLLETQGRGQLTQEQFEWQLSRYPKQFWFLVPHELVEKVKGSVPHWAGLLTGPTEDRYWVTSVLPAKTNPHASRLTPREMIKLGNNMANQVYSQARQIHELCSIQNYSLSHLIAEEFAPCYI